MAQPARSREDWAAAGYEIGPAGPVFSDVDAGDWSAVVARLQAARDGEVPQALLHPDVPEGIDVVWGRPEGVGQQGFGLAKLVQVRPEIVAPLPDLIFGMRVVERSPDRITLQSQQYRAVVVRQFEGQRKTWLLTSYERYDALRAADDRQATPRGRTDTAPPAQGTANVDQPAPQGNEDARRLDAADAAGDGDLIAAANRTARAAGAVGERALVPRLVGERLRPGDTVLDFGSGPAAMHAERLREQGVDVTAYDFGSNVRGGVHDPDALSRTYSLVYASNVLNVQGSEQMLRSTLDQIAGSVAPSGRTILNLPLSPRFGAWAKDATDAQRLEQLLRERFAEVERIGGTRQAPVFEARDPKGSQE